jgi:hypothetical protein
VNGANTVESSPTASSARSLVVLRLALLVAIALAARILWLMQHGEGWDLPALIPLLILGELPLVTAAVLVTRNKSHDGVVKGSGIAFGAALTYLLLAPLLYLDAVFTIWDTGHWFRNLLSLKGFIPISMVGGIWLLVSAFRQRRGSPKAFFVTVTSTIGYAVLAFLLMFLLSVRGGGALNERRAWERPGRPLPGSKVIGPGAQVMAITACLLRHRFLHPQDGFPNSLTNIAPDWNCNPEITNPSISPGYWLFYSPVKGLFTRRIADFRILDLPAEGDTLVWGPLVTDGRGEILGFQKLIGDAAWRRKTYGSESPFQTINRSDSPTESIYVVRDRVLAFMRTNHSDPPPSLEGVLNEQDKTRFACDETEAPTSRLIRMDGRRACFTINYYSSRLSGTQGFAISAQCIEYGDGCIRSYFLDYDGTVHATAEPRAATAQDSVLLPCETAIPCHDSVWIDSEIPSGWMLLKANVYYTIHTQNWW